MKNKDKKDNCIILDQIYEKVYATLIQYFGTKSKDITIYFSARIPCCNQSACTVVRWIYDPHPCNLMTSKR